MPIWLAVGAGCLLLWGVWYLTMYNGQWRSDVLDPQSTIQGPTHTDPSVSTATVTTVDPMVMGKRLYMGYCAACHQPHGKGVPRQYPPLTQSEWVEGSPHRLARILLHGLEGPIQVKGQTYQSVMPPLGPRMTDEQVSALLTYIRRSWDNQASEVGPELVKTVRQQERQRYLPWKAQELLAIPDPPAPEVPAKQSPKMKLEVTPAVPPDQKPAPTP